MKFRSVRERRFAAFGLIVMLTLTAGLYQPAHLYAQAEEDTKGATSASRPDLPERKLPADMKHSREAEVTIRGEKVPYRVTIGTQPVYGEKDKAVAALQYTYYERTDIDDGDRAARPFVISFNGGPGSASLWMHLGYTSPKQLVIDDEGYPLQPYGVRDNPHSILDVADIVYVNPVNTGFSRILDPEVDRKMFFGVEADIAYLADWLDVFVSRVKRWRSPKYLIGESYGTTRVSGLAAALQNRHWMYLNGVILVSPTGLGTWKPPGPDPRSEVLKLPYYTAAASLSRSSYRSVDLQQQRPASKSWTPPKRFARRRLPACRCRVAGTLDATTRASVNRRQHFARFSGLDQTVCTGSTICGIPVWAFWKELLRDEGFTIGRLDSRYKGVDAMNAGDTLRLSGGADFVESRLCSRNQSLPAGCPRASTPIMQYNLFGPVHRVESGR